MTFDALATIDFETYFDASYTIRKLTTEAYVRDPRFEVLGVGIRWGDRPAVWLEEAEFREWAAGVDWTRVAVNAHHMQFDGFILNHRFGIRPGFLLCTMSLARALEGPYGVGLEVLGPKYGVGEKGHELANAKGKHRADFTPEEYAALGAYCCNDTELAARLLSKMLEGFPVEELWLIDTTIRMFTEPVLRGNLTVLRQALEDERTKKTDLLTRIGATKEILSSADKFAALLRSMGVEPEMKSGAKGPIFAFAKTDPGMQALLEHEREDVRFLAEARLSAKSTTTETRIERLIGMAERGPLPVYLKYCGAHTHRWSGGDKTNFQNFVRGGVIRDALEAPEGFVVVAADSGQIEARKVAWVARQLDLLETFKRNDATDDGDFYSDIGSQYFRKPLSKKDTPIERQVSKSMVLGLGFGMGVFKFAGELLKGMLGADPVQFTMADAIKFGVDVAAFERRSYGTNVTCGELVEGMVARVPYQARLIHCAVTDYFVRLYRAQNGQIVRLWRAMSKGLEAMLTGTRARFGVLEFDRHMVRKPSGLVLHYPGLRQRGDGELNYLGGQGGRKQTKIYGGLLTENVVQSLARDVVAEQALRVRRAGYRVVTTTHDEIVCVVPKEQGPECLAFMLETMKIPPEWCSDLPLNAEGGIGKTYGEAK